jgi:glycine dehydrogenase subunit 2
MSLPSVQEPLLNKLSGERKQKVNVPKEIPILLQRTKAINIPNLDETQIIRHYHHLSQRNFGVDTGMYPLGSCTMKYNPKLNEDIASWHEFSCLHPHQHQQTIQGTLQMMFELEEMLSILTGMDAFTLQPAAGAHGEFLGMLLVRAFHEANDDLKRVEVITPDTAHGTNPASVSMAGFHLVEIPSTKEGTVDVSLLKKTVSEKTACFMLTNPNTLGIFESDILEIADIVHDAGGLLYYDGANMNAIMGKVRPGDMGFDIIHLNLHKTFSSPHGGGGPGSGPIGVSKRLIPFLPIPRIEKKKDEYLFNYDYKDSIGKIKSFYGNVDVLLRAYSYILLMGADGLQKASEIAVLNANYLKKKILEEPGFELPYRQLRKHEFVLSAEQLKEKKKIKAMDVAKRLLDYGVHPPTMYFPLIVKEALMIEPTETESKNALDEYALILQKIAKEDPELVKNAPINMVVSRIDEVNATRNPILTWKQIQEKKSE